MKILLVDDQLAMRRSVRNILKQIGITEVEEASDGSTALQRLRENSYDLVISDDNMDPMPGLLLLREIRADSALKNTPFIMMTATSDSGRVVAAKAFGVNGYIVKPFNADTLKQKIDRVLATL
jgi:two-component system, chemotaxis family, chemotaxis protein CheY